MKVLPRLLLILAVAAPAAPAFAQARGVGLGLGAGVAIPHGGGEVEFKPALNWGFFVDIPLLSTFHISPTTLVYALNQKGGGSSDLGGVSIPGESGSTTNATDVSLAFKFVIPIGPIEPFAGVLGGVTVLEELHPHVGFVGGLNFNVVANLDIFAQANYRIILADGANVRDLNIYAGPIFRFE